MSDNVFGAIVLAGFLVVVFAAGKVLQSFKDRRHTRAWAPLVPIIGGKVVHDGGGSATSWLAGTYRGTTIHASMIPDRNRYSGQTGYRYNCFEIALPEVPGQSDWGVEYTTAVLGFGETGWQIRTEDSSLEERLRAAGVIEMVTGMGRSPRIAYRAGQHTMQYSDDITPDWAPTPEQFTRKLDTLLALAKVNETVNRA